MLDEALAGTAAGPAQLGDTLSSPPPLTLPGAGLTVLAEPPRGTGWCPLPAGTASENGDKQPVENRGDRENSFGAERINPDGANCEEPPSPGERSSAVATLCSLCCTSHCFWNVKER